MMLKRIRKQPPAAPSPAFSLSEFQKKCLYIIEALKREDLDIGRNHLARLMMDVQYDGNLLVLIDTMTTSVDMHISAHRGGIEPGVISVGASYKNYEGYKLPWVETYSEKPTMFYKHKRLWVAVTVCFLTLCLRTDKQLWIPDPPRTPQKLRPKLTRIKKVATRN